MLQRVFIIVGLVFGIIATLGVSVLSLSGSQIAGAGVVALAVAALA